MTELTINDQGVPLGYPSSFFYDAGAEELYVVSGTDGRILITGPDYIPRISLGAGRGVEIGLGVAVDRDGNI